ncbi:MAG: hypothetical protein ACI9JM_000728 [Halioglobus sp.]|jgi:hypothetical protein
MTEDTARRCVLIPCSNTETWAVPQICLAEILMLPAAMNKPPGQVTWRDRIVPILDMGEDDGSVWCKSSRASGLVAIFLGLEGEACKYWGVAVRGDSLAAAKILPEDVEDAPEAKLQHAAAAFHLKGVLYQVPDLDSLQKRIAVEQRVA